jgi:hypothetical protein
MWFDKEDGLNMCSSFPDINECLNPKTHGCSQKCENTVGSFKCKCETGFALENDGKKCKGMLMIDLCCALFSPVCNMKAEDTMSVFDFQ